LRWAFNVATLVLIVVMRKSPVGSRVLQDFLPAPP